MSLGIKATTLHIETSELQSFREVTSSGFKGLAITESSPGRFLEAMMKTLHESCGVVFLPQPVRVTLTAGANDMGSEANFSAIGRFSVVEDLSESSRTYDAVLDSEPYRLRDIPLSLAYFSLVRRDSNSGIKDLLVIPKRLARRICGDECRRGTKLSSRESDEIQCLAMEEMLRMCGGRDTNRASAGHLSPSSLCVH